MALLPIQQISDQFLRASPKIAERRAGLSLDPWLPLGIPQRHLDQKAFAALPAIALALDRMIAFIAHFAFIRIVLAVFVQLMFVQGHMGGIKAEQAITEHRSIANGNQPRACALDARRKT